MKCIWRSLGWLTYLGFAASISFADGADVLRVQGSATAAQALAPAAPILREELGIDLKIATDAGSSQGIVAVGARTADLALSTRVLTGEDRAGFPEAHFEELQIGTQAVALAVAHDVWQAGVRALTKEQATAIYERQITNWKQLGGEDRPIKFYNPERGHGTWELFVTWLYGDIRRAPFGKFETVPSATDARDSVEFNAGSMSVIPPKFIDGRGIFALGIKLPDGSILQATRTDLGTHKYPLMRPLMLIAGGKPTGATRKVIDFMLSARGQEFVGKAGFFPVSELSETDTAR